MKTENELNNDILKITMEINARFPELSKYIGEMPVKILNNVGSKINIKSLINYYDSLEAVLKNYSTNHEAAHHNKTIWTIGHSTRNLDEFIYMLKSFRIEEVVDIRSFPGSRRYPHFNKEALEITLPENNVKYIHIRELGGRRKVQPDSINTGWRVAAFRGYADYMETEDFKNAIKELENIANKERTTYMCSEAVWWRCHRSLVSDYLKLNGWTVMHIMGIGKAEDHPYTSPARIVGNELLYNKK